MKKIKSLIQSAVMLFKSEKKIPIPTPINAEELLKGKVALITGGSGGIGFAIARSFLNSGAKVIIAGTTEEKLQKCCANIKTSEGKLQYIILDVLDVQAMPDKIRRAVQLFPENRIDILVNSAGVLAHAKFLETTETEYDAVMDINAKGTYFMSQAMAHYMIENGIKGHILNVSSSSALRPAWTPYHMSKWAVRGLTLGLADELLPHGIVVNAIAPGPTATPMLGKDEGDSIYNGTCPAGRFAMPSEIAALATFMVSGMGDMIVGDTFYMSGGSGTVTYHG